MKCTKITLLMGIALMTTALGSMAQTIKGTKHDFSTQTWNTTGQICVVCHTPHNASTAVTNAPLWNHSTSATTFSLYSSASLTATGLGQPDASSKLCLSCHDGTVALENFSTTTNGTHFITAGANIGSSLANDHPISFTYDATLATSDGGLYDPSTTSSGIGTGTIAQKMLIGGKLQCASCHDVHNAYGFTTGLLRKSNSASALCLTCHKK
jgi:predicted CXXCH cytochrome family protein